MNLFLAAALKGYFDPTTATTLIQILSAVVITCGVMVGVFWRRITGFFTARKMKRLEKKYAKIGAKNDADAE
ncbi:MAG: hypothetical protein FWE80_00825 [Oscillospiraceae bacterium]|nr:hypothetical protein [Oscillospiraceae bacterium]